MSSEKTETLGLNQWQLSDAFLMEEMNADNRKVDAAVAALPYVKLMDITTAADATQVDLNVSGIDFKKYALVQLFSNAISRNSGSQSQSSYGIKMKINGFGGYFDVEGSSNNVYNDYVGLFYTYAYGAIVIRADISGFQPHPVAQQDSSFSTVFCVHASGGCGNNPTHTVSTVPLSSAGSKLNTISFLPDVSGYNIKAGSRFVLYGVKI